MNIDDESWKDDFIDACSHYNAREYEEALLKIDQVLSLEKNNPSARNLKAAILIESWNGDAKNKSKIFEAIDHIKIAMKTDPTNKKYYLKNMGNAYYDLATTDLSAKKILSEEIIQNFKTAKKCFQESLNVSETQPDVWINKGNTLDHLGRYFEALDCYDRAILLDPNHYNAWGCRGICCWRIAKVVENNEDKNKLFFDSIVYIGIELKQNPSFEIDNSIKKYVNDIIQRNQIKIDLEVILKEQLPKKKNKVVESFNLFIKQKASFEEFYFNFCDKYNLFLNTHFDCNNCECSTLDLIEVSFMTNTDDCKRPYEFFKRWYSLIDDYKTSRLYLSLSQYNHSDFSFLDKPRCEPDFSLNYLQNVEILKNAYLTAINIYDKVAFFLNDYEELGLDDSKVSFWGSNSIFKKTDILAKNNWDENLVALYSIENDLEKEELTRFAEIRNFIVHRYFVLHDTKRVENLTYPYDSSKVPLDNLEYHMDIHDFFEYSVYALRHIRNILFSVSFFVSKKEKQKRKGTEGRIGELEWTHNWEKNDELTEAANKLAQELKKPYDTLLSRLLDNLQKELKSNDSN